MRIDILAGPAEALGATSRELIALQPFAPPPPELYATGVAVAFAAGLFLLGWAKSVYDIGLGAWIAGHVAYERRSRVVGLTETSWALGLLVGVSLMGLITGVASPRWAYAAAAVVVVARDWRAVLYGYALVSVMLALLLSQVIPAEWALQQAIIGGMVAVMLAG